MASYLTPEQIAEQYLLFLKTLKPEVNTSQTDSDWWIRSRVLGGTFSGVYADQRKMADDAFPQSARREALKKGLFTYLGETDFKQPTRAVGNVIASAPATGASVQPGQQFIYPANGNIYVATATVNFGTAATGTVPVQSLNTGQSQNLLEGATLNLVSAPAGLNPTARVASGNIADGRDVETNDEAAERILTQIQSPLAGGKVSDYEQFAKDADPAVTDATILRFPYGLGTVGVVITSGTTDIDTALDNNQPISLIPSDVLVQKVQDYIETVNPTTDCAYVLKPATAGINVTAFVRFASGDASTVPAGQTLTQSQLVQREIKRALYKTPPGGRKFGSSGFVVASEIEEMLDMNLSASPYTVGAYAQIISDRQVLDLSATGANRMLAGNELAFPGTITVNVVS